MADILDNPPKLKPLISLQTEHGHTWYDEICNQRVGGSSPSASSILLDTGRGAIYANYTGAARHHRSAARPRPGSFSRSPRSVGGRKLPGASPLRPPGCRAPWLEPLRTGWLLERARRVPRLLDRGLQARVRGRRTAVAEASS